MTDLLEQMKARAEQAQTAYEAYKAECEKVEELPEMRPMTCKEVAMWCSSVDAAGWVYRVIGSKRWHLVTAWDCYDYPIEHERAPIATLNDDGTGGEWEAFEVQA